MITIKHTPTGYRFTFSSSEHRDDWKIRKQAEELTDIIDQRLIGYNFPFTKTLQREHQFRDSIYYVVGYFLGDDMEWNVSDDVISDFVSDFDVVMFWNII